MIGGIVIKTIDHTTHKTLVVQGVETESLDVIRVDVEPHADVEESDTVWWQGGFVYVTRGSRFEKVFCDVRWRKIGQSYGHFQLNPNARRVSR